MSSPHQLLIEKANAAVAAAAASARKDPLRPAWHLLPPAYWMNDPNGMMMWKGQCHLFYQHNPFAAWWGGMHWAHAVSDDFVHWRHLPIAMAPEPDGPDKDGVWSGCIVDDGGVPTAVYTGVRPECQCLATSADDLLTWQKRREGPVVAAAPPGYDAGFRDPWVWREGGDWMMAVGAGRRSVGGALLLYRSRDLRAWEYLNPLFEGDRELTGRMWECPFFFPLGGKWALVMHPVPLRKAVWFVGEYRDRRFGPERQGTFDFGVRDFYTSNFVRDAKGRWITVAAVSEARDKEAMAAAGWAGVLTCPREVFLNPDGTLGQRPLPELESLRGAHDHAAGIELTAERKTHRSALSGDSLEIALRLRSLEGGVCGLKVRASPNGEEETSILYDRWSETLTIDRQRSSLDRGVNRGPAVAPLRLGRGEPLDLRVFVDRSLVEVFANGGLAMTARIYPTRPDSTIVETVWPGGPTRVESLDVWEMKSIG